MLVIFFDIFCVLGIYSFRGEVIGMVIGRNGINELVFGWVMFLMLWNLVYGVVWGGLCIFYRFCIYKWNVVLWWLLDFSWGCLVYGFRRSGRMIFGRKYRLFSFILIDFICEGLIIRISVGRFRGVFVRFMVVVVIWSVRFSWGRWLFMIDGSVLSRG